MPKRKNAKADKGKAVSTPNVSKTPKVPKTTSERYLFYLVGVNLEKVDIKYGIGSSSLPMQDDEHVPENTTRIDELDIVKKTPEIISFLDESKRVRKCTVSMIDFFSDQPIDRDSKKYKCYWDKHDIPPDVQPIGCPIRYVASRATKSYHSEISKEQYTISEYITENRAMELVKRRDDRITVEKKNYYETDGVFCSFNCCMAYIIEPENKHNPIYRFSEMLLLSMYNDFVAGDVGGLEIMPAPHWRLLTDFGGTLDIDKFRESFNKILYVYHGTVNCRSIGRLYEDQIKF